MGKSSTAFSTDEGSPGVLWSNSAHEKHRQTAKSPAKSHKKEFQVWDTQFMRNSREGWRLCSLEKSEAKMDSSLDIHEG